MYFSDVYSIPDGVEFFDPLLDDDTPLFVDPFLIFRDEEHRTRTSEEGAAIYHRVIPQVVCELGAREYGARGNWAGSMQEPSLQAGRSVAERSSELVRSLAPCYEKVLQEVSEPVGTSRDFTSTCAFPFGPASEYAKR